jgi:hypothetical protein
LPPSRHGIEDGIAAGPVRDFSRDFSILSAPPERARRPLITNWATVHFFGGRGNFRGQPGPKPNRTA